MVTKELEDLINQILLGGDGFLGGIHTRSPSFPNLVTAVNNWGNLLGREMDEIIAGVEPSIRQSVFMTLIPCSALEQGFSGSYEKAIQEHISALGLELEGDAVRVLRDVIINIRKLQGMNSQQARSATKSLAQIRGDPKTYVALCSAQDGRCKWCGVPLHATGVYETLEHMVPKHLGDDMDDGSNWALACETCNMGKSDALAWSAKPSAHDYLQRDEFAGGNSIPRSHRWVVLRRSPSCATCRKSPRDTELHVFKRIVTGLPIPANCSVTCQPCADDEGIQLLRVDWSVHEKKRA